MRPHPKLRRTIKWTGLALSVVLAVVWVGSGWVLMIWASSSGWIWSIRSGRLGVGFATRNGVPAFPTQLDFRTQYFEMLWVPVWERPWSFGFHDSGSWRLAVPLGIPAALTIITTAIAWRLDILARRRARIGQCAKCGYDLKGLAGGAGAVCPECGRAPN